MRKRPVIRRRRFLRANRAHREAPARYLPANYTTPPFPSLYWPPQTAHITGSLYYLSDIWRFTLLWTLIFYAIFYLGAAAFALAVQLLFSGRPAYWRYLWMISVAYTVVSGV